MTNNHVVAVTATNSILSVDRQSILFVARRQSLQQRIHQTDGGALLIAFCSPIGFPLDAPSLPFLVRGHPLPAPLSGASNNFLMELLLVRASSFFAVLLGPAESRHDRSAFSSPFVCLFSRNPLISIRMIESSPPRVSLSLARNRKRIPWDTPKQLCERLKAPCRRNEIISLS